MQPFSPSTPRFASTETSKDFATFNDLAVKSEFGKEAIREQCEAAVETAKERAAEKAMEQSQEKSRGNNERAR